MGSIRFTKKIKLLPGLTLNVNKQSLSLTAGVRGAHATINTKGQRTLSAGLPGTGLSYRDTRKVTAPKKVQKPVAVKPEAITAKTPVEPSPVRTVESQSAGQLTELKRFGVRGAEVMLVATTSSFDDEPPIYMILVHDPGELWEVVETHTHLPYAETSMGMWQTYLDMGGTLWFHLMNKDDPNNKGAAQQ